MYSMFMTKKNFCNSSLRYNFVKKFPRIVLFICFVLICVIHKKARMCLYYMDNSRTYKKYDYFLCV